MWCTVCASVYACMCVCVCVCVCVHACVCVCVCVLSVSSVHTLLCFMACMHTGPLGPLDQRPALKDLDEKVVLQVASKWFNFGLHLDIKPEALDAIKTPNGTNKEHCLEMFKCWLVKEQGCGSLPRTWSSVVHAVENSCGSEVSRELSKLLQNNEKQH